MNAEAATIDEVMNHILKDATKINQVGGNEEADGWWSWQRRTGGIRLSKPTKVGETYFFIVSTRHPNSVFPPHLRKYQGCRMYQEDGRWYIDTISLPGDFDQKSAQRALRDGVEGEIKRQRAELARKLEEMGRPVFYREEDRTTGRGWMG